MRALALRPLLARLSGSRSARVLLALTAGLAAGPTCTSVEVVGVRVSSVEVAPGSATITEGATRQFAATVRDDDGTPIPQAQVTWSVVDGAVARIDAGGLTTGLAAGTTVVRATFQGTSGQATLTVEAANGTPTVAITAPADGASFQLGDAITFTGTASDPEDGTLSGASLAWTSQIDGAIGSGASFTTSSLSLGTHIITLRATDSGGASTTTQIGLAVVLGAAPTVTSITPDRGPPSGGTSVTVGGTRFESGATVTIGGAPATNVQWVDATTITATTPAGTVGAADVVVTNPDTQAGTLAGGYTYTPGPSVALITPSAGPTAGGTRVTIAGSGFEPGATVTLGGTPATNVVVQSGTSITATTPSSPAGVVDVVVTNPDTRAATLVDGYTYAPPPTVTSITPSNGPTSGGTSVTITGTGFVSGAGVTVGGRAATGVRVNSSTSITATTPIRPAGPADVVVTNPDGQSDTLRDGFTYDPGPTVTSITPSGGNTAGGTPVTIAGTGFASGATVTFGGAAATNVVRIDSTTITATTPANPAGVVDVEVTNPDAQTGTLVDGYTYAPAPTVASITPDTGPTAGGTSVTITGTDFVAGATVTIGGVPATSVVVVDATSITADTPGNSAGVVDVVVTNPDGQTDTLVGGFTYLPGPAISAIAPTFGPTAGGTAVTITGTGFLSGAAVSIGGAAATGVTFIDATTITATTPAGTAGAADVVVTNPDAQTSTLAGGFTFVPPPTVTSVSPNNGPAAGGTAVTITGAGFVDGATVTIGGVAATDVTFVSSTSLTATTEARAAGTVDVVVTNPDTQTDTLVGGFTYDPPPTVASISPNSGPTSGGTSVTITGADFVVGATVTIGGVAATNVGFVNSTSLTALTPGNPSGTVDVVVTNPDTQAGTLAGGFTYLPGPAITSIAPDFGPTSGGTAVTITGTGFVDGAVVTIGGAVASNVTFVDATSITATTPAGAAGDADVVVTNPDAQTSTLTGGFTYVPPPVVSAISPNSGPADGGTDVTISGTGFVDGATVEIGGALATGVTFVDATSLTATTPAGAVGTVDVVVTNLDTQSDTLSNGFTYEPPPTVTSITPSNGPTSGGTSVTITGSEFVAGATVTIGGTTATNVGFVNSTSLTALTPVNPAGPADVVVTNPDGQSDTLVDGFTYDPGPTVTAISPDRGPVAGGTSVTITGTGLVDGAAVTIGGNTATSVVWVSSTQITANTPAGAAGDADVVVTNPDTQTGTLTDGFTYDPPPTVTSITPANGPAAGGTSVTITGTDFVDGATVTIGGVAATGVTFGSSTSLTATTGARVAGTVDVVVANPDGQSDTLVDGFT
ncbi:MAG TPA: IPT/TIG domain-containing protein, partial [Longimicrobiales bacterium]|nr:IPT/TIG domain-containing protein [Longimicrobiales bacterium]